MDDPFFELVQLYWCLVCTTSWTNIRGGWVNQSRCDCDVGIELSGSLHRIKVVQCTSCIVYVLTLDQVTYQLQAELCCIVCTQPCSVLTLRLVANKRCLVGHHGIHGQFLVVLGCYDCNCWLVTSSLHRHLFHDLDLCVEETGGVSGSCRSVGSR